jgi:hypothetical protein
MLIYLDTSHIRKLAEPGKWPAADIAKVFDVVWHHNCALAVSPVVLCEIAQQTRAQDVTRDVGALSNFPEVLLLGGAGSLGGPLPALADTLVRVEITHKLTSFQMERFGVARTADRYREIRSHWQPVDVDDIRAACLRDQANAQDFHQRRVQSSAFHTSVMKAVRQQRAEARQRGAKAWPPPASTVGRATRDEIVEALGFEPLPRHKLDEHLDRAAAAFATSKDERDWAVQAFAADDIACLQGKPLEDISTVAGIFDPVVAEWVRVTVGAGKPFPGGGMFRATLEAAYLDVPPSVVADGVIAELRASLDVYDLPGTSHYIAATRGQVVTQRKDLASNFPDADHVTYAPYVDLHFVDGRTFKDLERQKAENGALLAPHLRPRIREASSASALVAEIEALATGLA